MTKPYYVYEFYAAGGACLYVGRTSRLDKRLSNHSLRIWWPDVAGIVAVQYPDKDAAALAERESIHRNDPQYNTVFTDHHVNAGGWATRRAHLRGDPCDCQLCRKRKSA